MKSIDMSAFCGGGDSKPLNSRGCKSQKICYNGDVYNHKYNGGFMKKFFAFTLAEVLITLGIIGVVAALTIPTLISNHQKKVYVTQFKKAYNTVTNAFKLIQADTGSDNVFDSEFVTALTVNSSSNEQEVNRLAKKYFNIAQDVKYISQSSAPEYRYLFYGNGTATVQPYGYLLKTADGADIYLFATSNVTSNYYNITVFVDVNGSNRNPNTSGRDYFHFWFDQNLKTNLNNTGDFCNKYASHSAEPQSCTKKVMQEGWEMNY